MGLFPLIQQFLLNRRKQERKEKRMKVPQKMQNEATK
jgi:hypothetical protein